MCNRLRIQIYLLLDVRLLIPPQYPFEGMGLSFNKHFV